MSFGCWFPQHNILLGKIAFIVIGTTGKKGFIFASQETKAQSVNVLSERSLFQLTLFPTYKSNVRFFSCML